MSESHNTYSEICREKGLHVELLPHACTVRDEQDEETRKQRCVGCNGLSVATIGIVVFQGDSSAVPSSDERNGTKRITVVFDTGIRQH